MRFFKSVFAACSVLFVSAAASHAEPIPPVYPVDAYAKMPLVSRPSLSPDGRSIAYLTSLRTGRPMLLAHPISGMQKGRTIGFKHIKDADISSFRWANSERLLITVSFYAANQFYKGILNEQTRLVSTGFDGETFNLVKPSREQKSKYGPRTSVALAQRQSDIIDMLFSDPDHILLAFDDDVDGDPDVRSINVANGRFKKVQNGYEDIYEWLTNAEGKPLLGYGDHEAKPHLYLDKSVRDIWSYDAIYELLDSGLQPVELHEDGTSAYFYTRNQSGHWGLARFDLTTGDFMRWVYTNPTYDMASYIRSDITNRIVGARYIDTLPRQVFVDGVEEQVLAAANTFLPGASNQIISSDRAGNLFLIASDASRKTPRVYAFDTRTQGMSIFANRYDQIKDAHVAPVQKHVVAMRDGLEIEVYVTTPIGRGETNLPAIMMPHGGPSSRDSAAFDVWAQFFANRGYVVLQPNFRGSSGYGAKFSFMSDEAWGRAMQDDVTDSTQWAIDSRLVDGDRICIMGGSYGGYAALMAAVKTPDLFKCAISMNGVADLPMMWTKDGNFVGGKEWRKGIGEKRAELKEISPYHRADEINIPILLIAAKDDARVDYRHSKKMHRKLKSANKPVEYVQLKNGGHGIDIDETRVQWFTAMGDFVDDALTP